MSLVMPNTSLRIAGRAAGRIVLSGREGFVKAPPLRLARWLGGIGV
jgi:hypothetical protein